MSELACGSHFGTVLHLCPERQLKRRPLFLDPESHQTPGTLTAPAPLLPHPDLRGHTGLCAGQPWRLLGGSAPDLGKQGCRAQSAGGAATGSLPESVRGHLNADMGAAQQLELSGSETRLPLGRALPQEQGAMDARQAVVTDRTLPQDKQTSEPSTVTAGTAGQALTAAGGAVGT